MDADNRQPPPQAQTESFRHASDCAHVHIRSAFLVLLIRLVPTCGVPERRVS